MTSRFDEFDQAPDGDPTEEVFRAIAAPPAVPDLTGPIMGRLGFMRAAPAVVRRRRRRRAVFRGTSCLLAGGVIGAALYVHSVGPDARRPSGLSIPAAIGHEVEQQQEGFNRAIKTIRDLAPVYEQRPGARPPAFDQDAWPGEWRFDEDIDRSALGPMRWL